VFLHVLVSYFDDLELRALRVGWWILQFCSLQLVIFFVASITSTTGLFCPFLQTSVYFLNFDMLRELIYFLMFHGSINPTKISNKADFFCSNTYSVELKIRSTVNTWALSQSSWFLGSTRPQKFFLWHVPQAFLVHGISLRQNILMKLQSKISNIICYQQLSNSMVAPALWKWPANDRNAYIIRH